MKIRQPVVKQIYDGTYAIEDNGFGTVSVYMYLLEGSESALMIDCGYGMLDLKSILRQITNKPVVCACTHGHIDHALGAAQFDLCYLHSRDFPIYKAQSDPELRRLSANYGLMGGVSKKKRSDPAYQAVVERFASFPCPPQLLPLDDVCEFQLGNRRVTWRPLPGHTPGSVVFYDEKYNVLFDSDAASATLWLHLAESLPLSEYRRNLIDYLDMAKRMDDPKRYAGHQLKPARNKDLENLLYRVDKALTGKPLTIPFTTPFYHADILPAKGGMLFYDKKRLY